MLDWSRSQLSIRWKGARVSNSSSAGRRIDLGAPRSDWAAYRWILETLGPTGKPTFWVPRPIGAPARAFLLEPYNLEASFAQLHGLHDATEALRHPDWGAEYRLRMAGEPEEYSNVFPFTTRPGHTVRETPGSWALAELIETYRSRVVQAI
jgi:hypothetical protein